MPTIRDLLHTRLGQVFIPDAPRLLHTPGQAVDGAALELAPCCHVVCDLCFDGGTCSACPVCEHHVDRTSPFFRESPVRGEAQERVRFKRLDLCEDADQAAQELLASLCRRKQAMSPDDRAALVTLVGGLGLRALDGLPQPVPVRENEALVLGTLLSSGCPPEAVLAAARGRLRSGTAGGQRSLRHLP